MGYEKELNRIIKASQNNTLVFFVGAGISKLSGAPSWDELIDVICKKIDCHYEKPYSSDQLLQIPQMFYYSINKDDDIYYSLIKSTIESDDICPNRVHTEMLNLDPIAFITTNYDELIERSALENCLSYKVVSCDSDVPGILGDRVIYKIHGDFNHRNIVLKEEDYLNYSDSFKLIETMVKSVFSSNTVVFIGYGLNDYNIRLILNWTKELLKEDFRKPLFVHTGKKLTDAELVYHESKGLTVIDVNNIIDSCDYEEKYLSLFESIRNLTNQGLDDIDSDKAFDNLYHKLTPLDRLLTLRHGDVAQRLYPYVMIDEYGCIKYYNNDCNLLSKFISISHMSTDDYSHLSNSDKKRYETILHVFNKARITVFDTGTERFTFSSEQIAFADKKCIHFDYSAMMEYVRKDYKSLPSNYRKAFYLFRLFRYNDALLLFSDVAKKAFNTGDYLLYFLSKANSIWLNNIIKSLDSRFGCYYANEMESLSVSQNKINNLYNSLPAEFKNDYYNLKTIHDNKLLYSYYYDASIDSNKLLNSIRSNSMEFGVTSSDRVIFRINDYLHFFLGNGIVVDVFSEYKNAVKAMMSSLLYKYSVQDKEGKTESIFSSFKAEKVYFDEIDFYCFIECFDSKDLLRLIKRYNIKTIDFNNIEVIEESINNLIKHYSYLIRKGSNQIAVVLIQNRIKTLLTLLRYVDVSQSTVNCIVRFILNTEFRDITISDKVLFLDHQLYQRGRYSPATEKHIEDRLIKYIDQHSEAIIGSKEFNVVSSTANINYYNLVHYIKKDDYEYHSRRLSQRVKKIIDNNLESMYPQIIEHYFKYISSYQKHQLVSWTKKRILSDFNFNLFRLLIISNARLSKDIIITLKQYLWERIKYERTQSTDSYIKMYPSRRPYDELIEICSWCLSGTLKKKDFLEFIGICPEADFYLTYRNFDFDRFDTVWLLNCTAFGLDRIASNRFVKDKIRKVLADDIAKDDIKDDDKDKLKDILVKHFC